MKTAFNVLVQHPMNTGFIKETSVYKVDTCVFTNTLGEAENEHPKLEGNDYTF